MKPVKTKIHDLQLRDKIAFNTDGPYTTMTVTNIEEDKVTAHRPHIMCQDFSYTGGVIWSVGIETVTFFYFDSEVILLERPNDQCPLR
jgi:hypothetical protein